MINTCDDLMVIHTPRVLSLGSIGKAICWKRERVIEDTCLIKIIIWLELGGR